MTPRAIHNAHNNRTTCSLLAGGSILHRIPHMFCSSKQSAVMQQLRVHFPPPNTPCVNAGSQHNPSRMQAVNLPGLQRSRPSSNLALPHAALKMASKSSRSEVLSLGMPSSGRSTKGVCLAEVHVGKAAISTYLPRLGPSIHTCWLAICVTCLCINNASSSQIGIKRTCAFSLSDQGPCERQQSVDKAV